MAVPLTDHEVLAKYGLENPHFDALRFAQLVNALAMQRRAQLGCQISYKQGELVQLTYAISGTDSEGQPIATSADSGLSALASLIREFNRRYASRMPARRP